MAANLRPTCGSERGAAECNTQRLFAEEPQVGHGTAEICLGVSSLFLIYTKCETPDPQVCRKLHPPEKRRRSTSERALFHLTDQAGLSGARVCTPRKGRLAALNK